jgi:hypothetical protein
MLTKPFNDDLAWQVQRELVNSYFRTRAPLTEIEMIAAMAADAVRQQKRLNHVEEQIETSQKLWRTSNAGPCAPDMSVTARW